MRSVATLCPFLNETKPSLKINLERKIFTGSAVKGDIIKFVALMEKETRLAKAAEVLARICGIPPADEGGTPAEPCGASVASPSERQSDASPPVPAVVNPPLTFTPKLEPNHPYLDARNVKLAERETFGLGYCDCGMMRGRIAIPIHNERGELVA